MSAVPRIDLSDPSQTLGVSKAIQDLGFLAVTSPGTPTADQINQIFALSRDFFLNESVEQKQAHRITVANKGWISVRQEALDHNGYPGGDIKEAFNLAKFSPDGTPNQPLPPILAAGTAVLEDFMRACHELGNRLLRAFALDMGLDANYFTSRHTYESEQSSILRLLYYPPTPFSGVGSPAALKNDDIRAGAHSDYGSLTLLFQKDIGGLQILLPTGPDQEAEWLDAPVDAAPDSVLVNIGDAFDFWTAGRFKSTVHRVVAPRNEVEAGERFSIAYFLHPADSELLIRIPHAQNSSADARVSDDAQSVIKRFGIPPDAKFTAKEWLLQRLAPTYTDRKEESS